MTSSAGRVGVSAGGDSLAAARLLAGITRRCGVRVPLSRLVRDNWHLDRLLDQAGVVVAPGTGYGPSGEGYVRLTLAIPDARVEAGCERILGALAT